ncbi:MAG: hypothetical protein WAX44_02940 [Minisyncoccia bacterium]
MIPEEKIENIKVHNQSRELREIHYYGDEVRMIFLIMAVIILILTPFFKVEIPLLAYFSVFGVLILSMLAGLTSPKARSIIIFNFLVSLTSLLVFGYELIVSFDRSFNMFFVGNLVLSILSIFAVYFSSKTLRGNILK